MKRQLKDRAKQALFALHAAASRVGIHVTPVHYYSPLPHVRELRDTRAAWAKASSMPGIRVDLDEQELALRAVCLPHRDEYLENRAYDAAVEAGFGPGYGPVEAQALHGVVRHFKPRRIIEVGSGVSTACILAADAANQTSDGRAAAAITCIEPYPSRALRALPVRLMDQGVQAVPFETFQELGPGDLLFIDSSHAVKPGSDVNHLYLEVLPRLRPGVIVHVHDIFFPYDYSPDTLKTFLHWSETTLLRAYLAHNDRCRILMSLSMLFHDRPEVLAEVFPGFEPMPMTDGLFPDAVPAFGRPVGHFPSSTYLQMLGEGGAGG